MTNNLPSNNGSGQAPRLLDQVRAALRLRHYSYRTEQAYVHWTRRYILFHGKRHPDRLGAAEVEAFLSALATDRQVSASTQNQALAALLFLYRNVLEQDLPWLENLTRAKPREKRPVVLTREETVRLLDRMTGVHALMGRLIYGTGMRLMECCQLRIKDVDFGQREITIRSGKGGKDRVTMLPASLLEDLQLQCAQARAARCRPQGKSTRGVHAGCPGAQIPARRNQLELVLAVSRQPALDRPRERHHPATSHLSTKPAARHTPGRAGRWYRQASHDAHAAPQLCHSSAHERL